MGIPVKDILKPDLRVKVNGSLWLEANGVRFFGPGPAELLERIGETGSISEAAKAMRMSYKKAWELVNTLNKQSETPLIIPRTGGEHGGGSVLTEQARALLQHHRLLRERFNAFLAEETDRLKS